MLRQEWDKSWALHRERPRAVLLLLLHMQSLGSPALTGLHVTKKVTFPAFPALFLCTETTGKANELEWLRGRAWELSWGCSRREWVCLEAQADIGIRS